MSNNSQVYFKHCKSYDKELIKKIILDSFKKLNISFKKNNKILIKPNLLSQKDPSKAVTTNPVILDALLDILVNDLKNKQLKIFIGESSGISENGGTTKAFDVCGISSVAKKYSIPCISFDSTDKIILKNKKIKSFKKTELTKKDLIKSSSFISNIPELVFSKKLLDVDIIINLPKLKTHVLMGYTGAIKNLYGLVPGNLKIIYHTLAPNSLKFSKILYDIFSKMRNLKSFYSHDSKLNTEIKTISIMDGIIGMEGNGPANGKVIHSKMLLISKDFLALDYVATKLIGFNKKLDFLKIFDKSKYALNQIQIVGDFENILLTKSYSFKNKYSKKNLIVNFKKPTQLLNIFPDEVKSFLTKFLILSPKINQKSCKKCLVCKNHCPNDAISFKNNVVKINLKKCIHCFCCHELCPYDSIDLKRFLY